ncbi:MAG: hypothetical protein A2X41_04585 [Candidatus Margulisbacteria bacterium GWE2_39_32]|nr:MAG: hypothetical protein A2X41_04585 [Candidatus Margulisbacteria bacterium GWE2_39_32]
MSKNDTTKILETDLFNPIHNYFKKLGYEVHGEVKNCDITATKGDELIIIELKRNLSIELLIQAAKRQRVTDYVYVAIPKPRHSIVSRKWKDICFLVRRLELGLITVTLKDDFESVEVIVNPCPFDRTKSNLRNKNRQKSIAREIDGRHGNFNLGGSTRIKIMTAYKENTIHIACCLKNLGPLSPSKLRELGTGNKTLSILSKNFYGWFAKKSKGIYGLSEKGNKIFDEYVDLIAYYEKVISAHKPSLDQQK